MKVRSSADPFEALTAIELAVATVLVGLRASLATRHQGLNEHEIMLLGAIKDGETIGEASRRRAVAVKNISQPLLRLEEAGYVTIEPHESDRRRRIVRRTAKGRAVAEHALPVLIDLLKRHIGTLSLP